MTFPWLGEGIFRAKKRHLQGLEMPFVFSIGNSIGNYLYNHGGNALPKDAELLGCTPREIDDTTTSKRATIGDTNHNNTVIGRIGNLQPCAKGMSAMGTGQAVVMQSLATAGESSRSPLTIIRSDAFLHALSMQK